MQSRPFAKETLRVSEVGLGTWQLGSDWGQISQVEGLSILYAAIAGGVSFFDTADVYGDGVSEEVLGMFLEACPDEVVVATKVGRFEPPGWPQNFQLDTLRSHVKACARRLKTPCLDLLQLHCLPLSELRQGRVFDSLRRLRDEGLIRRFGASVETVEEGMQCLEQEGLSSLQVIFNLYRQEAAAELLPAARERGVAVIARLPFASGLLTDKFRSGRCFNERDHRNYNRDGAVFHVGETFAGLRLEDGLRCNERLREGIPEGMEMKALALRWILDHDAVTTVIPGASNPDQIVENCAISKQPPLPAETHAWLESWFREHASALVRGPR